MVEAIFGMLIGIAITIIIASNRLAEADEQIEELKEKINRLEDTIEKKDKTITFLAGHFEDESWAFYKELGDDDFII